MLRLKIKLDTTDDIKEFLNETVKIKFDVDLIKGSRIIDAKSTIGVMTLDLSEPVEIAIHSENKDLLEPFKKWQIE